MKVNWPLVGVTAAALLVAACGSPGGGNASPAPATSQATPNASKPAAALVIKVTGTCNDNGGMRLQSSGFTPNSSYTTQAWYPNGAAYSYILNGTSDQSGATPNWRWDCNQTANGQPDTAGTYKLTMTDNATGRSATTTFVVKY